MDTHNACSEFLHFCQHERHLSANTLAAYQQDLAEFERFETPAGVEGITGDHLVSYAAHLAKARSLAPASVKRRLACVRAMCAWLVRRKALATNPFTQIELRVRIPTRLPRCLNREETKALIAAAEGSDSTTRLALHLLLATGIRVGELTNIRIGDVNTQDQTIRILGKGSKERQVFLPNQSLADAVSSYVATTRQSATAGDHLLQTKHGGAPSTSSIRRRIKSLGQTAGLSRRMTPHMMRHTAATGLLEAGVDIRLVQRLLGHHSISTTQIYTHVSDTVLKAAVVNANVCGRLAPQALSAVA
jgi:site-specific recombinase XerD